MSRPQTPYEQSERRLLSHPRAPMPEHAGDARYQASLDRDRAYREMIVMALAIATVVSTGFGQSPSMVGPIRGALFCLAAGGFAIRATYLRFPRSGDVKSWSYGPSARFAGVILAGFGVLGSALGGLVGLLSIGFVVGAIGIAMFASDQPNFRIPLYLFGGVGLTAATAWTLGTGSGPLNPVAMAIGFVVAVAMSAHAILGNAGEPFEVQPMLVLTSLSAYGWLVAAVPGVVGSPYDVLLIAAGAIVMACATRWTSLRSSFAPVVFAAIVIQLAGYVGIGAFVPRPLIPQAAAMLIEFALLGITGYRQAVAALARFPLATYRASPQCLVPAQDHAWDHPIRIDAV